MNTQLEARTIVNLPEGFTARGADLNDVEPALALYNRWSRSVIGRDEITDPHAVRNEWKLSGFAPAEDIRLVFAPNGQMVGYVEVWTIIKPPVHPWIWGRVDPDYEDQGIGTWLMHWAEQRALRALNEVPTELRFALHVGTFSEAEKPKKLFADMGYQHIRSSYRMLINMDAPVPEAAFPEGITLRTYDSQIDPEAIYRAEVDSFRDHFGYVEEPFEEGFKRFKHFVFDDQSFDPTLLFLAMDDSSGEIAGINVCRPYAHDDPEMGWVGTLGVRRRWRKRGIGLALLRHSFYEFYRRGQRKVGLGVDAQNLTGALRLYQGAGMHVQQVFDRYEKEVRAGKEISVQSLQEETDSKGDLSI